MKAEVASEQRLGVIAPLRNVEPKESVGALPESRQLCQIVVTHTVGINPAQHHGLSSLHFSSTTTSLIAASWPVMSGDEITQGRTVN